jgi:hypothetical protein
VVVYPVLHELYYVYFSKLVQYRVLHESNLPNPSSMFFRWWKTKTMVIVYRYFNFLAGFQVKLS